MMHRKALDIRMTNLDEDHPCIAESHYNMEVVYNDQGNHKKAILGFPKALEIQLKILGDKDPWVADTHNNLGCALDKQCMKQ